jgi:hypothetical protein
MWRDTGSREQASRSARVVVPPDALAKLPIFVAAPGGGKATEKFNFTVRSTDGEGETDTTGANFERPRT